MKKSILILLILPIFAFLLIASTGFLLDMSQKQDLEELNIVRVATFKDGVETTQSSSTGSYLIVGVSADVKLRLYFTYSPSTITFDSALIGLSAQDMSLFVTSVSDGGTVSVSYTVTYYVEMTLTGAKGGSDLRIFDKTNPDVGSKVRVNFR